METDVLTFNRTCNVCLTSKFQVGPACRQFVCSRSTLVTQRRYLTLVTTSYTRLCRQLMHVVLNKPSNVAQDVKDTTG